MKNKDNSPSQNSKDNLLLKKEENSKLSSHDNINV